MKRQAGFTLVEIAIVLVVIGLLLGGVLKGQELILNSQIRNSINEYNNVASARFAYQDRYRVLPGDDPRASDRWDGVEDGDGNRRISGVWNAADSATETAIFWQHLRNDGLVNGARTGNRAFELPRGAFDGDVGVQEDPPAFSIPGSAICQSNIPLKAAIIIDTRIDNDDGTGSGAVDGSLQAVVDEGEDTSMATPSTVYSAETGPRYIMCREL